MNTEKILDKSDLNGNIKFGAEQLFVDEEKDDNLNWTESAIEQLLDRNQSMDISTEEKKDDLLSSFKIAKFDQVATESKEEETENEKEFWGKFLKPLQEIEETTQLGKRKRRKPNMAYYTDIDTALKDVSGDEEGGEPVYPFERASQDEEFVPEQPEEKEIVEENNPPTPPPQKKVAKKKNENNLFRV